MSVLTRYRRPGGFKQLLQLIETSQPVKQAKLLEVVESEDPVMAERIRQKKITTTMVMSWPVEHLVVILENMHPMHLLCIMQNLDEETFKLYAGAFSPDKYREVKSLLAEEQEITSAQMAAAQTHMLETVRFLDEEKKIDLRYIDPALDISEAA